MYFCKNLKTNLFVINRLEGLQEVHRRHVSDLERSQSHLVSCKEEIERIENDRPRLSERFKFFQITRGYVQDLIDCLTTKVSS